MSARIQGFRPEEGQRGGSSGHRQGTLDRVIYPIDTGIPGLNLGFTRDRVPDGFFSPRHHHCWDQFRYVLEGQANVGKIDLAPGECGYFPEGVYYGPQSQKGDTLLLVLQFPGPSRNYFLTPTEMTDTFEAIKAGGGVFENGIYRGRKADGRPANQDGYEALWETHQQHKLVYPEPRYNDFIVMKPGAFTWLPDPEYPGLEVKRLGAFTEYQTAVALRRMAPGTTIPAEKLAAPEIRYVLEGSLTFGGREYPAGSCLYIPAGVASEKVESRSGVELFVITLPMFIESAVPKQKQPVAA